MLFNSLQYAAFFPIAVAGYFLLPYRWRVLWLVITSCVFYMAYQPAYILVLAVLIGIDWGAALKIEKAPPGQARVWLILSICATCAVLFTFKYFGFFLTNLELLGFRLKPPGFLAGWALPVGLSFHTFQSLAYVIEVYYKRQTAERDPLLYAGYVLFFPQLVAGPIERPQNLLFQFREHHRFEPAAAVEGTKRIFLGLFKKAMIADRLGMFVDAVFSQPQSHSGMELTLAAIAFTYQIYCDFSGYSDMAIGSARILGFRLSENFDTPLWSVSVGEFWRRWHVSLSLWFRDYVFIPLGGSRGSRFRTAVNYAITFTLSGLWHGASWHYVWWGTLNGIYLIAGRFTRPFRDRIFASIGLGNANPLRRAAGVAFTFALTCAAFTLFRAPGVSTAVYVFTHFHQGWIRQEGQWLGPLDMVQQTVAAASIGTLEIIQLIQRRARLRAFWDSLPSVVRQAVWVSIALATIMGGVYLDEGTFIYFQF